MAEKSTTLVQGTLDMLILRTLELQPMHGWGIATRIEQISKGVFQVNPGSLFPAFRRLERAGWLASAWKETENKRRAKYYSLTGNGRKQLQGERREWKRQAAAIARIPAACSRGPSSPHRRQRRALPCPAAPALARRAHRHPSRLLGRGAGRAAVPQRRAASEVGAGDERTFRTRRRQRRSHQPHCGSRRSLHLLAG